jgi:hypothetical protein
VALKLITFILIGTIWEELRCSFEIAKYVCDVIHSLDLSDECCF